MEKFPFLKSINLTATSLRNATESLIIRRNINSPPFTLITDSMKHLHALESRF